MASWFFIRYKINRNKQQATLQVLHDLRHAIQKISIRFYTNYDKMISVDHAQLDVIYSCSLLAVAVNY